MIVSLHKHKDEKERRLAKFAKEQWQNVRKFLIRRYSLSEEDCADVFNESLMILWQNLKENKVDVDCMGTEEKSNSNYFMTICRNKTMERLRNNKRYTKFNPKQDKDEDTIQFMPDKIDTILALDEDYNNYQEEKDSLVRTIINDLPSPCNELLWGYYGNGNSIRELAEDYYKGSESAVKVTKHRCTNKFRERFNIEYQKLLKKYNGKN